LQAGSNYASSTTVPASHTPTAPGSSPRSNASATTTNTIGIGLGLAVARGLTEALGGTLEPDDTPGGGLTMVISLPCDDSPRTEPPAGDLPEANVLEDLAAVAKPRP
jgi:hypothetical protein